MHDSTNDCIARITDRISETGACDQISVCCWAMVYKQYSRTLCVRDTLTFREMVVFADIGDALQ